MSTQRGWLALLLWALPMCLAHAQQSPAPAPAAPQAIPRPDQLEPAVTTSPETAPAAAAPQAGADPAADRAAAKPAGKSAPVTEAAAKPGVRKGADRVELGTTDITGNRELPKVLYIVPWKSSDLGDLTGKPVNSLLDEVLQPLDRDVFQRENRYYDGLKANPAPPKAGAAQGSANKP
jgi:hypothetical protein